MSHKIMWYLKNHIFKPFRDGGVIKSLRTEFKSYMDDRLTKVYDGEKTILPRDKIAWRYIAIQPQTAR